MKIPSSFKNKIAETFYDKSIKVLNKTNGVDDEGWAGEETTTELETILGNVRFDNLAQVQEDYGLEENVDITVTTNSTVGLGEIIEYEGVEYKVINSIPYDSHNLLIGTKWLSKYKTLTSV